MEITARCNLGCRHCYINLPAGDMVTKSKELTAREIDEIANQAVDLGAMWVLLSGGEPLLRDDFEEIFLNLKRKGMLVSVFTNATLIDDEHIALFKKYPPRDIEVTVYGASEETYERVTRRPGSYNAFIRGLNRLFESGLRVRLKSIAMQSNYYELPAIADFCRARTKDYFRFDPQLHLRFDQDAQRNAEIMAERLTPEEIVALEKADKERFSSLRKHCDRMIQSETSHNGCNHLFHCGTGNGSFNVSYDGLFRLCSSLWSPGTLYDLRKGTIREAWENRRDFLETCSKCELLNLCLWCPAHAYLETGEMDMAVRYFCEVAHARAKALYEGR
jgi:radical SAM protein with 4Fe4S-binding SPASM domain